MKKLLLSHSLFLIPYFLFAQNVGIGTTTPVTKLHVVSSIGNVATFSGASSMYITLAEGASNRGYIGSFAGNPEDVDFGTYGGNTTGKVHLTIQDVPKLTVNASGNIGIGTTDPLSLLHVKNGAVLFDSSVGTTPVSGPGTRLMWIPAKSAFRAGFVIGSQWNDASIGVNSVAMGNTTTANGFNSTALGSFAVASGDYSIAIGSNALASGEYSTATGIGTISKSFGGFVAGTFNDTANAANQVNYNPLNRIFQIGNGTDDVPGNAMTVLQNGNTGIGTTAPGQKLDVNGAIEIGNTATGTAGAIRFNGTKFEGHNGTSWTSFDQLPVGTLVSSPIYPNTNLQNLGFVFQGMIPNIFLQQTVTGVSADTWLSTSTQSTVNPSKRERHSSIWTGTEMISWGGDDGNSYLNTGVRYSPGTNIWTNISTTNAPSYRENHSAIWTGTDMIIWGGGINSTNFADGSRYNPVTDSWTSIPGNLTIGSTGHTAIWTGGLMIIWGGQDFFTNYYNSGSKYNPSNNTWTAISTTNAPSAREFHTAIWTGTEMIIWGGTDGPNYFNTGAKYNPSTNTWTTITTTNAPSARDLHTAIWTGTEMIIWGGYNNAVLGNTGAKYNPSTNTWTTMSTTNAPSARYNHTAVWTGTEMIIWGGNDESSSSELNTGARYNPSTNTWTTISTSNVPSPRSEHTAVWSGNQMIIYGGGTYNTFGVFDTGGRYFPTAQPAYNTTIETSSSIYLYSKQ